ncbi:MAG TPA: response regulator [Methylomirabilota bacterium]|nr:response regulator [Methylomirabilota bacterium]
MDARLILVVDGDIAVRQSLIDLLSLEGHEVDGAEDAEAALLLLEQRRYDLVIADVRMEALDGPTLIAALHARFADAPPRVAFLSGQTFDPQYGGFLADLRAPMLMKPLRPGPALELIARMLAS